jgi:ADP-ribose pyrophosphatase YjhB (NUDIX family)
VTEGAAPPPQRSRREYPERPWVAVGVIVFRGEEVLLIRRGRPPRQGEWSIPGGAQRLGETVEEAARRELREECGVEAGPLTLACVVDVITRDEEGKPRFHYTILDYAARWTSGEARAGGDAAEAAWVPPASLPELGIWPEALKAIAAARGRLTE